MRLSGPATAGPANIIKEADKASTPAKAVRRRRLWRQSVIWYRFRNGLLLDRHIGYNQICKPAEQNNQQSCQNYVEYLHGKTTLCKDGFST
jgi:hypothetical protein